MLVLKCKGSLTPGHMPLDLRGEPGKRPEEMDLGSRAEGITSLEATEEACGKLPLCFPSLAERAHTEILNTRASKARTEGTWFHHLLKSSYEG